MQRVCKAGNIPIRHCWHTERLLSDCFPPWGCSVISERIQIDCDGNPKRRSQTCYKLDKRWESGWISWAVSRAFLQHPRGSMCAAWVRYRGHFKRQKYDVKRTCVSGGSGCCSESPREEHVGLVTCSTPTSRSHLLCTVPTADATVQWTSGDATRYDSFPSQGKLGASAV